MPRFTTFSKSAFNFFIVASEHILGLITCLSNFFIDLFHSLISDTNCGLTISPLFATALYKVNVCNGVIATLYPKAIQGKIFGFQFLSEV